ncbi:hypothetical protein MUG87_18400 [Ectobacillus sp. JY-23]|jgi:riboflavin kinase|uniref:hypothetical protein n=1 Tax=Ectobacillus sp. JY-23 TaxID=2933872 RepID=UPI001FF6E0DA|nr:hypothetical protein [Ectobacillus sp. JY-23]UOY92372.1 hypothetical protein MUG87_18400 [Ectobacillus sp. JY-23]
MKRRANASDSKSQTKKSNPLEKSQYLHLPDVHFFHWCNHRYKLNKSVYNTIDKWFYSSGVHNILYRRTYIVAFLHFVRETESEPEEQKFVRFGNGGLVKKLMEFEAGLATKIKFGNEYFE